jgi:metal-responsive CopG/Arc/MetJ family transcriptional regulator
MMDTVTSKTTGPVRKVTISLPQPLLEFADWRAAQTNVSRSQVIGDALLHIKELEEEKLAAEGYQFYAQEAVEFASASAAATAAAWNSATEGEGNAG